MANEWTVNRYVYIIFIPPLNSVRCLRNISVLVFRCNFFTNEFWGRIEFSWRTFENVFATSLYNSVLCSLANNPIYCQRNRNTPKRLVPDSKVQRNVICSPIIRLYRVLKPYSCQLKNIFTWPFACWPSHVYCFRLVDCLWFYFRGEKVELNGPLFFCVNEQTRLAGLKALASGPNRISNST